ncbi:hypothetical protein CK203_111021 [Vitis vinifera]|uniref:Uncharacterized protein n=1 Tax=Vitis vinifera TaxID=29760 RepID=A0A438D2U5_VITVI|nr:hypothetical protein CK203_111021 [Vitis vinifera]
MHSEFEMSMIGELNFFLGLQIKQLKAGTFINQAKYIRDLLKRFNMVEAKTMKTPMSSSIKLDMDEKGGRPVRQDWGFKGTPALYFLTGFLWFSKTTTDSVVKDQLPLHFCTPRVSIVSVFLFTNLYSLVSSSSWLLNESQLPLRHRASTQLSHLSKGHAENEDGLATHGDYFGADFPNLVQAFYSRVTYGLDALIISIVRGVEIHLDLESICRIFYIAPIGLKVYESKIWPIVSGFEPREVIQRICGLANTQEMGKPSTHNLTIISRVLHHMTCSIFLPRGGHRDDVSYYEAFLIDSVLTGRRIHLGYLMMMNMISCCESMTHVLPYGCFLTRIFKDVSVNLRRETDFEALNAYDTYDDQSMGWMKFEKAPMVLGLGE